MSQYVERNLNRDETIVLEAQKSFLYLIMPIVWTVIIFGLAIFLQVKVSPFMNPEGVLVEYAVRSDLDYFQSEWKKADEWERERYFEMYEVDNEKDLMKKYEEESREENTKLIEDAIEGRDIKKEINEYFENNPSKQYSGLIKFLLNVGPIAAAIIWGGFFLIGALPTLIKFLRWLTMDLALTNKRVIGKMGILSINALDFHIDKVDHVQIKAGVWGKLFHFYSLKVVSVGGANQGSERGGNSQFIAIKNAPEFKNAVTEAIEQHSEEARRAQAEEIARAMGK